MTSILQARLAGPQALHAPGAYDALSALLIEQAGFEALYLSGGSIAYSQLGRPDIGLVGFDEVASVIARVRDRVAISIIVDADTGYGNALNVQRTVRVFERNGADAIQLEDQTLPKRCGHLAGKAVIPAAEMVGKLHAALDARRHASTLIVARTDAIALEGLEAALDRAELYLEAGADLLFVEALRSIEEMQAATARFAGRIPLVANMVEGGHTPILDRPALSALGFRLVISPGVLLRTFVPLAEEALQRLHEDGSTLGLRERMTDLAGINARIGLDAMLAAGRAYEPAARGASTASSV